MEESRGSYDKRGNTNPKRGEGHVTSSGSRCSACAEETNDGTQVRAAKVRNANKVVLITTVESNES